MVARPWYAVGMTLEDDVRDLVRQLEAAPDEVAELAADAANIYRRERIVLTGMEAVDSMVEGREVNENDPRLEAARRRFLDRLKALLTWARETGRMT